MSNLELGGAGGTPYCRMSNWDTPCREEDVRLEHLVGRRIVGRRISDWDTPSREEDVKLEHTL